MKTTLLFLMLGCSALAGFSKNNATSGSAGFDEEKEKKAILLSVTNETELAFKGDFERSKKYYVHSYYTFIAYNNSDGTFYATVGSKETSTDQGNINEKQQNQETSNQSNYPKVERRNLVFKFFTPELAFVTWDQYNSDKEMKMFYHSKETRIMEKHDGLWKIANMTALWDYKNLIPVESLK